MPLNLQKNLPAVELLKKEHIFVMDSLRASEQDIRPLRVVVLNLMPLKITTETDLVRLLSNTPLQVELDFMKIKGHTPKNTPIEHMKEFYKDFDEMQDDFYDGMIITGAPVGPTARRIHTGMPARHPSYTRHPFRIARREVHGQYRIQKPPENQGVG